MKIFSRSFLLSLVIMSLFIGTASFANDSKADHHWFNSKKIEAGVNTAGILVQCSALAAVQLGFIYLLYKTAEEQELNGPQCYDSDKFFEENPTATQNYLPPLLWPIAPLVNSLIEVVFNNTTH